MSHLLSTSLTDTLVDSLEDDCGLVCLPVAFQASADRSTAVGRKFRPIVIIAVRCYPSLSSNNPAEACPSFC